jgi:hypothetical protein
MTDAETPPTAATVPAAPYDPKAIFLEEWNRVAPTNVAEVLGDTCNAAKAWALLTPDDRPTGRAVDVIPIDTYRLIARSSAHACLAVLLTEQVREHGSQADALKRIAHHDLRHLGRVVACATYDVKEGLVRECVHEKDTGHAVDAKVVSIPVTAVLVDLLKKAGIFGGT